MSKKIKKNNYSGMSLVEMLIAIGIFTIGIAGFTELFVRSWQNNHFAFEMGQSSSAVSQGLEKIGSYLKRVKDGADGHGAIVLAKDNELTVYCDYDKDKITERLHFFKEAYTENGNNFSRVMMGVRKPDVDASYAASDASTEAIVTNIMNDDGTPIFYYYDKDYAGGVGQEPIETPVADNSSVRLVKVYLKINIDPNRAPDNIEMQSFNEMRNLNDYDKLQ
jgi:Tfp pilus assembly protein PilV